MNEYYIVDHPASTRLIEQSWYYECLPYDDGSFLVPEHRVVELFGRWHRFHTHSERLERMHENSGYHSAQYPIEFE